MSEPFAIPWPVDTCAICLEAIQRPATIDPCGHSFCFDCIRQWLTRRNQCVTCRGQYFALLDIPDHLSKQLRRARENDVRRAATFCTENTTIILTPMDSKLFVFFPVEATNATGKYYSFHALDARKIYFMRIVQPGTLWVLPENFYFVSGTAALDAENYNYSEQDD